MPLLGSLKSRIKSMLRSAAARHLDMVVRSAEPDLSDLGHPLPLIERLGTKCKGVIHVGANSGQEFEAYRSADIGCVIYIEPIPHIFRILRDRISLDPRHIAVNALCSDRDGERVTFHVASNNGQSSSILKLGRHKSLHADVSYVSEILLRTSTLDRLIFDTPGIDANKLDCLVLDVQGAEAKVLAGATRTLSICRFVFAEVSTGGLYVDDCSFDSVVKTLQPHGFILHAMRLNRFGYGNAFFVRTAE